MTDTIKMAGNRVLVTGAAGFIGSHLVHKLVERGAEVTAFIRYNSRGDRGSLMLLPEDIRERVTVIAGDLRDPSAVQQAVDGQAVVFHLAALIGIPYSYVHPVEYVQTNIVGTTNVLEACRRAQVSRLVHFSTSEVYGTARYVPIDEEHPLQGQSPYSASKIAADQLALSYHRAFGTPVAVVRPFNTYGPRQPTRVVIPTIISQALRGDQVRLGALSPTRDLTYVEDTAEGVIRVAESAAALGEVINIGSSFEISIGDLAQTIFRLLGKEPEIVTEAERMRPGKSEVERLFAATDRAQELLGWRPRFTLEQGLERTIDWVRGNLDFFSVSGYHV